MSTDKSQPNPSNAKPESNKPGNSAPPQNQNQHDAPPRKPIPFDTSDEEKATPVPDPQPGGGMFV